MLTNSSLTIYHKTIEETTRLEKWVRYNIKEVWWFGGKGSSLNKGYEDANDVDIRIPYKYKPGIGEIKIGDILVKGDIATDITTQNDLKQFEVYNITSINDNNFGNNPHIRLGGK